MLRIIVSTYSFAEALHRTRPTSVMYFLGQQQGLSTTHYPVTGLIGHCVTRITPCYMRYSALYEVLRVTRGTSRYMRCFALYEVFRVTRGTLRYTRYFTLHEVLYVIRGTPHCTRYSALYEVLRYARYSGLY